MSAISVNWIPHDGCFKSLVGLNSPRVGYFIDSNRSWNRNRIQEWFVPMDGVDICNIPRVEG